MIIDAGKFSNNLESCQNMFIKFVLPKKTAYSFSLDTCVSRYNLSSHAGVYSHNAIRTDVQQQSDTTNRQ